MFKLIVAGSRDYHGVEIIRAELNLVWSQIGAFEIVSGGARGVDRLGAKLAEEAGIRVHEFLPDWEGIGKSAGFRRNEAMADFADGLLAFWDGNSRGTKHMIDTAKARELDFVRIVKVR